MLPEQDLYGMEMSCFDDNQWSEQQRHDNEEEQRAVAEAYDRIYLAINRLEVLDNCSYSSLRSDVRLTELASWRK